MPSGRDSGSKWQKRVIATVKRVTSGEPSADQLLLLLQQGNPDFEESDLQDDKKRKEALDELLPDLDRGMKGPTQKFVKDCVDEMKKGG